MQEGGSTPIAEVESPTIPSHTKQQEKLRQERAAAKVDIRALQGSLVPSNMPENFAISLEELDETPDHKAFAERVHTRIRREHSQFNATYGCFVQKTLATTCVLDDLRYGLSCKIQKVCDGLLDLGKEVGSWATRFSEHPHYRNEQQNTQIQPESNGVIGSAIQTSLSQLLIFSSTHARDMPYHAGVYRERLESALSVIPDRKYIEASLEHIRSVHELYTSAYSRAFRSVTSKVDVIGLCLPDKNVSFLQSMLYFLMQSLRKRLSEDTANGLAKIVTDFKEIIEQASALTKIVLVEYQKIVSSVFLNWPADASWNDRSWNTNLHSSIDLYSLLPDFTQQYIDGKTDSASTLHIDLTTRNNEVLISYFRNLTFRVSPQSDYYILGTKASRHPGADLPATPDRLLLVDVGTVIILAVRCGQYTQGCNWG